MLIAMMSGLATIIIVMVIPFRTRWGEFHAAARGSISLIPGADDLFILVLAPSVSRRQDECFKDLANVVEEIWKRVDGVKIDDLAANDASVRDTPCIPVVRAVASDRN